MSSAAILPILRHAVSYVPSPSLIWPRQMKDLPLVLRRRPHEADFLALDSWTRSRPQVLDVGANRGQSIRSLRLVLDRPVIHSVEPNPFLAAHLVDRYRSDDDVTVHQLALSDEPGALELFLPRYGHTVYDTRASLGPEEPRRFLGSEHFTPFRRRRARIEQVTVEVGTIDGLGLSPDLIKVDVEGADDRVVAGGMATIDRCSPMVLVEYPRPATAERLESLGYAPFGFDERARRLERHAGDGLNTFFLRPEHLDQLAVGVR